jgi:hypothetical protein
MNTKTLKAATLAVSLIAGMGAVSPAMATSTGVQALGVAQNSVDVWTFTCPILSNGRATVQDIAPVALLNRVQVVLGKNSVTSQVQDNSGGLLLGEGGASSAAAVVNGGTGLYAAAFKKTLLGGEGYIGNLYCVSVFGGAIINPAITRQINQ